MNSVILIVTLIMSDGSIGSQVLPAPPYITLKDCVNFTAPKVEYYHQNISPESNKLFDINTNCVIMKVPIEKKSDDGQARKN